MTHSFSWEIQRGPRSLPAPTGFLLCLSPLPGGLGSVLGTGDLAGSPLHQRAPPLLRQPPSFRCEAPCGGCLKGQRERRVIPSFLSSRKPVFMFLPIGICTKCHLVCFPLPKPLSRSRRAHAQGEGSRQVTQCASSQPDRQAGSAARLQLVGTPPPACASLSVAFPSSRTFCKHSLVGSLEGVEHSISRTQSISFFLSASSVPFPKRAMRRGPDKDLEQKRALVTWPQPQLGGGETVGLSLGYL